MSGNATAPASSGNLGPGFDVLAMALGLRCSVVADVADTWSIAQDGTVTQPGPNDLVRRAVALVASGPFRLEISNDIPRSRGLGSSAAVAVAAAAAALRATGAEPSADQLFEMAAEVEGHADNAAAAVFGGFVAVAGRHVRHLEIHPDLRVVVGIPESPLSTADARAALPGDVSRDAAARNLARIAFLIEGIRTGDPAVLASAGGDEMHELPRHALSPVTGEMMDAARQAGAYHAAWSGAGPSALALAPEAACDGVQQAMERVLNGAGEVVCLDVDYDGWS